MLPKNSVGTKQLAKEAVTPAKLSKAAKKTLTGATGATGATGPQGPKGEIGPEGHIGPKGEPAGTDYFALVKDDAEFEGEHPGFTSVTSPEEGVYCLGVEAGVSYYDPVASVEWSTSSGSDLLVEPLGQEELDTCGGAGELEVRTYTFEGGVELSEDVSFVVELPQP
jgi:hypothetical protein